MVADSSHGWTEPDGVIDARHVWPVAPVVVPVVVMASVNPIRVRRVQSAVLIPVKAFRSAKARLRGQVSDDDRARLARWMAERVLDATIDLPTFVACDDDEVAAWASGRGAQVLWGPGLGLNGAIDQGVATIGDLGFDHVTIAHGDLPLPTGIGAVDRAARQLGGGSGGIVLVPDRRHDGTNVQSRPCGVDLPATYGAASFSAHLAQALASGLPVAVRFDERLALDIDTIDDCRHPLVARLIGSVLTATVLA